MDDFVPTATPDSLLAAPLQSIELKNLNVTVPVNAKPISVSAAVSYTLEPSGNGPLTVLLSAAFLIVVAMLGVAALIVNGSQLLTAELVWLLSPPAMYCALNEDRKSVV